MNIDLDAILDTPVQTSLFVDCFDDLMDSLSSDFPLNGEFDSILADLHESSTVLTPEPSPLLEQNVPSMTDPANEQQTAANETNPETIPSFLQNELLSSTSLEQFDAMMFLSGNSPPSEQYQTYESSNFDQLPTIYPPDIVDTLQQEAIKLDQVKASEPPEADDQKSVTQQTLVVQSAGQQFEIGISFSIPSEQPTVGGTIQNANLPTQQALTAEPGVSVPNWVASQEPEGLIENMPQVQWTLAPQPTQKSIPPLILPLPIVESVPRPNNCMPTTLQASLGKPVDTNFHDNFQNWLDSSSIRKQPIISATQNMQKIQVITLPADTVEVDPKQAIDHMIIEEQPATLNVETIRNYVHIPNSYVINSDGTSKTFIVHEVYKVADSKKRTVDNIPESLHELSQPNRKRPRKSAVIYDTDFLCVPCQKTFGKRGSLKQHIRSYHSEPLPFHCDTCGKNFATEVQLQRHVVNHDQRNKKFKCAECDKRYVHSKDRDRHFLTHHGVPAHTCGQCRMAFARRDHLLAHEMTHERRQSREALVMNTRKVQ